MPEAFVTYLLQSKLAEQRKRREFWIVGPNYSDSEKEFRVLYNQLKRLQVPFDRPGTYNDPIQGNMHISLWDGTFQVHAKSAAHPESLVGEGLRGIILAEAAKIKQKVWTRFLRATLNDFGGWALLTSTPEGKNWFYDMWKLGQDPNVEAWGSFKMPSWANPHVYPMGATQSGIDALRRRQEERLPINAKIARELGVDPEIMQLLIDLTPEAFNQEIAADFTEFVGRVFKDFDEEVHVADLSFNPEWQTFAAVDYGFTNPNVWLLIQVDPHGEQINVLGEVYERGLSPEEFAAEIKRRGLAPAALRQFYPDPASPGDTRVLEQALKARGMTGTGGSLPKRLDAIRGALKPFPPHDPEARPRILFDRSCVETIRDMNDYRYPDQKTERDTNAPENPMKKDDHAPEALGRFFAGFFGTVEKRRTTARSGPAQIRR